MLRRPTLHLPRIVLRHKLAFAALVIGGLLTFGFHGQLGALLAAATSSLAGAPAVLYLTPYTDTNVQVHDTLDVDAAIQARVPINAIEATIKYPADAVEIVGINKQKSFLDLWTEDTTIKESEGEVHFSGGTTRPGGLVGTGTLLTLSIRAKKPGDAKLYFQGTQVLAHDGNGTPLTHDFRSLTIHAVAPSPAAAGGSAPNVTTALPSPPNPDLDGNGKMNLVDVSMLTVHLIGPYDPRYDLDQNGSIGIADISILFSKMKSN